MEERIRALEHLMEGIKEEVGTLSNLFAEFKKAYPVSSRPSPPPPLGEGDMETNQWLDRYLSREVTLQNPPTHEIRNAVDSIEKARANSVPERLPTHLLAMGDIHHSRDFNYSDYFDD